MEPLNRIIELVKESNFKDANEICFDALYSKIEEKLTEKTETVRESCNCNNGNEELDPVNKKALKGKHKDRKDKDIDNDGDVDASDKFLHKRRKAISKSKKNGKEVVNTKPELKDNGKDTEMSEKQESRRPIFDRIMEKAGNRADHVKGATPPEAIDSKASKGEKDFVAKHGGLEGTDSGIDGAKAAADTIKNAAAGVKAGPGRPNDNKSGDKSIIKSTEA